MAVVYLLSQNLLALPFRETNDKLHEMKSPVTLDFLIPGGFYMDDKVTIREVIQKRFQKPGDRLTLVFITVSESVPATPAMNCSLNRPVCKRGDGAGKE